MAAGTTDDAPRLIYERRLCCSLHPGQALARIDPQGWLFCVQCHPEGRVTCPACRGSGADERGAFVECWRCAGSGSIASPRAFRR